MPRALAAFGSVARRLVTMAALGKEGFSQFLGAPFLGKCRAMPSSGRAVNLVTEIMKAKQGLPSLIPRTQLGDSPPRPPFLSSLRPPSPINLVDSGCRAQVDKCSGYGSLMDSVSGAPVVNYSLKKKKVNLCFVAF